MDDTRRLRWVGAAPHGATRRVPVVPIHCTVCTDLAVAELGGAPLCASCIVAAVAGSADPVKTAHECITPLKPHAPARRPVAAEEVSCGVQP